MAAFSILVQSQEPFALTTNETIESFVIFPSFDPVETAGEAVRPVTVNVESAWITRARARELQPATPRIDRYVADVPARDQLAELARASPGVIGAVRRDRPVRQVDVRAGGTDGGKLLFSPPYRDDEEEDQRRSDGQPRPRATEEAERTAPLLPWEEDAARFGTAAEHRDFLTARSRSSG
jgi:hypothetical protein